MCVCRLPTVASAAHMRRTQDRRGTGGEGDAYRWIIAPGEMGMLALVGQAGQRARKASAGTLAVRRSQRRQDAVYLGGGHVRAPITVSRQTTIDPTTSGR